MNIYLDETVCGEIIMGNLINFMLPIMIELE